MNIFVLDRDPARAARYHCDRHVVKMLLETAQLLSTALWLSDPERAARLQADGLLYRPTHAGHPCARWLLQSPANCRWLARLGLALIAEYHDRYGGRRHASEPVIRCLAQLAAQSPGARRTPFAQAMPAEYQREDPVEAYRAYYRGAKQHIARWTRRRPPRWFSRDCQPALTSRLDT